MKIAVLRIAGDVNLREDVRETLKMLNLGRKHACVVVEDTPSVHGMLLKVKDTVTWGTASDETIAKVLAKRQGEKKAAFMHPPRGGYERKGVKVSFKNGGVLGDRGAAMDELLQRML